MSNHTQYFIFYEISNFDNIQCMLLSTTKLYTTHHYKCTEQNGNHHFFRTLLSYAHSARIWALYEMGATLWKCANWLNWALCIGEVLCNGSHTRRSYCWDSMIINRLSIKFLAIPLHSTFCAVTGTSGSMQIIELKHKCTICKKTLRSSWYKPKQYSVE